MFHDEGRQFNLVSLGHVVRDWSADDKRAFDQYAWPVSSHIWVTWSAKPEDWRPMNHSCWPNVWYGTDHSLNGYARFDIKAGEQVTMDYATYGSIEPFECSCGATACRKTVSFADYANSSELRERYGTRISHFLYLSVKHSNLLPSFLRGVLTGVRKGDRSSPQGARNEVGRRIVE